MKKSKWKSKFGWMAAIASIVLLMGAPAWAESEEKIISQFEKQAIIQTQATRVMVKTPGHILFAMNPENRDQIQKTMETLASSYRETVKSSEPVRVYFMIGGGIAGVRTFNPGD